MKRQRTPQVQAVIDIAAMVWNADTNQMAVTLIKDGTPEIISEQKALRNKDYQNQC